MTDPTAFDALAADYDAAFTLSPLGQLLRPRVWRHLAQCFGAGDHVLELACGTGADAVWLARRGVRVTATDGAARMVALTAAKAEAAQVETAVQTRQLSLQQVAAAELDGCFDGVLANFGGLNTIGEWRPLARALAGLVRPGGYLLLVPMGPVCPWEMAYYLWHGRPAQALRRWRPPATAVLGDTTIPVWYPSARRLRRDFAPWFRHARSESLALWLPPSYLGHWVQRWPGLFARLNTLEQLSGRLTAGWGDHYILILQRGREALAD